MNKITLFLEKHQSLIVIAVLFAVVLALTSNTVNTTLVRVHLGSDVAETSDPYQIDGGPNYEAY